MNLTLVATLGGLLTLIFWGLGDYFAGKSARKVNAYVTNWVVQLTVVTLVLPLVFWLGMPLRFGSSELTVLAVAAMFTVAFISFMKAMAIGPFGVAAPIGKSYSLVTLVVSVALFGMSFSRGDVMAMLIIITGVMMLVVSKLTFGVKKSLQTVWLSLVATLFWGVGYAILNTVADEFAWHQLLFLTNFLMLVVASLHLVTTKRLPSLANLKSNKMRIAWQTGFIATLGATSFFWTIIHTKNLVIVLVITAASPLVTSFIASRRDREKLSLQKRLGAAVIVCGIIVLNLF